MKKWAVRFLWVAGVSFALAAGLFIASFWIADPVGRHLAETGGVLATAGALSAFVGSLAAV